MLILFGILCASWICRFIWDISTLVLFFLLHFFSLLFPGSDYMYVNQLGTAPKDSTAFWGFFGVFFVLFKEWISSG